MNAVNNLREVKRRQEQSKGKGSSISGMFSRGSEKPQKKNVVVSGTPSNQ